MAIAILAVLAGKIAKKWVLKKCFVNFENAKRVKSCYANSCYPTCGSGIEHYFKVPQ